MPTTLAGRSTRMEVLELLRRKGHASAETIASDLGVTPNAVRQHLTNLERDGFVVSHPERRRRGLATEPMSCPADAFNSGDGLAVLRPGDYESGSWTLRTLT